MSSTSLAPAVSSYFLKIDHCLHYGRYSKELSDEIIHLCLSYYTFEKILFLTLTKQELQLGDATYYYDYAMEVYQKEKTKVMGCLQETDFDFKLFFNVDLTHDEFF
jgi:D-alanyl-lipoteichoic acid acyltransferase DltB (MBOAT superfamily)